MRWRDERWGEEWRGGGEVGWEEGRQDKEKYKCVNREEEVRCSKQIENKLESPQQTMVRCGHSTSLKPVSKPNLCCK